MNAQVGTQEAAPVSLGDWIITLIVLAIPIVGLVMLFVWGFSAGTNPSKQNFCRASLIMYLIMIVIAIFFVMTVGLAGLAAMRGGATL